MKTIMCSLLLIPCFFIETGLAVISFGFYFGVSDSNYPMCKYLINNL